MNKDNKWLVKLYESIYSLDFFTLDEKDFDINRFLTGQNDFFVLNEPNPELSCILESFEKTGSQIPTKHGEEDVYLITLHNGLKFKLHLNYIERNKTKDFLESKKISANYKKDNDLEKEYSEILNNLEENGSICMIMFEDENSNTNLTGKVGMSAKELFVAIKNSLLDSWSYKNINRIIAIGMRVKKNEEKRLKLYNILISHFLHNRFPKIFLDKITEEKEGNYLLFAAK